STASSGMKPHGGAAKGGTATCWSSALPTVSDLIADPIRTTEVPPECIAAILAEVSQQEAHLVLARSILAARLATAMDVAQLHRDADDLLDAHQAARRLGMSIGWLYKNARKFPFTRRIGRRTLRFSAAGIADYQADHQSP